MRQVTATLRYRHQSCHVGWGGVWSRSWSTMLPSFVKIGPRAVEICHFPMLSAVAYIIGQSN